MPSDREFREREIVDRLLGQFERLYARRIRSLQDSVIEQAHELYLASGIVFNPQNAEEYLHRLVELSKQNSSAVIPFFSNRVSKQLRSAIDDLDRINNIGFHTFLAEDWASSFALSKSKLVSETTFAEMRNVVQNGIVENLTNQEVAKNLLKLKTVSKWRARAIARTESHQAATFASAKTAERVQLESGRAIKKVWVPKRDSRTRNDHIAMLQHPAIPLDSMYQVGIELMARPGDPNASAANVVNCRCAQVHRMSN